MFTNRTKNFLSRTLLLLFAFAVLLFNTPTQAVSRSSHSAFTLTAPGVALEDSTLLVAARLNNTSHKTAFKVKIDSIRLDSAPLLTPLPTPIAIIEDDQSVIVEAQFNRSQLRQGQEYQLVIRGSYQLAHKREDREHGDDAEDRDNAEDNEDGEDRNPHHKFKGQRHTFIVKSNIVLPPVAPGAALVTTVTIGANKITGAPFPPLPPSFDEDETNPAGWTVPTGKFIAGTPTPSASSVQKASIGDPQTSSVQKAALGDAPAIVFNTNNGIGITNGDTTAEPSGATGGGVVFVSANSFAAYSTNGGSTFTQLDPTRIFPNDAIGFCCDQIVHYVPSIDRFVWLLQGSGFSGYRLAVASPAQIIASGGTAWTYWNLPASLFGSCSEFDYPDMSLGNSFVYMSWDAGGCSSGGFQVARTSFAGLAAGGTITIEFTDPANGSMAWGSHLMQNTGNEIFWAGHNKNSSMRVFSLAENSNTYFWRDIGVSSWANNAPTSLTPDGQDWLCKNFNGCTGGGAFPGNGIIGSTRVSNQLWFAWSAGTDNNFQQPHVEMVTFDRNNNFSKTQQVQIWNNSYAFAYPALTTNACTGEVGLSFEYGGNGNYENHVVGFWGDFVAYITTGSNVGTTRFGDYVTIRQTPPTNADPGNLFSAFGYGLNSVPAPGTGTQTDIHYVLFGRPASSCKLIE